MVYQPWCFRVFSLLNSQVEYIRILFLWCGRQRFCPKQNLIERWRWEFVNNPSSSAVIPKACQAWHQLINVEKTGLQSEKNMSALKILQLKMKMFLTLSFTDRNVRFSLEPDIWKNYTASNVFCRIDFICNPPWENLVDIQSQSYKNLHGTFINHSYWCLAKAATILP